MNSRKIQVSNRLLRCTVVCCLLLFVSSCEIKEEVQALGLEVTYIDKTTSGYFNLDESIQLKTTVTGSQFSTFYVLLTYLNNLNVAQTIYLKDESNSGKELNLSTLDEIKQYTGEKTIEFHLPPNLKKGEPWSLSVFLKDETGSQTRELSGRIVSEWLNVHLQADANAFFSSATGNVLSPIVAMNNPDGIDITYGAGGSLNLNPTLMSYQQRSAEGLGPIPSKAASCRFVLSSSTISDFQSTTKPWKTLVESYVILATTPEKVLIKQFEMYGFQNLEGKKGLIYVNQIIEGEDGYVSISVKAEK